MNDTYEDDLAWARGLFEGARGGDEPAWTPDTAVIGAAGARRHRIRMLGTGSGALAVAAATALLATGLGAGAPRGPVSASPIPGWGDRPLSDVFQYVGTNGDLLAFVSPGGDPAAAQQTVQRISHSFPYSAALDTAVLLVALDPGLDHLTPDGSARAHPTIIADSSPDARMSTMRHVSAFWYPDARATDLSVAGGTLGITYLADTASVTAGPGTPGPCGLGGIAAPDQRAAWGACRTSALADGSRVEAVTGTRGPGTEVYAVRVFPDDRGAIVLSGGDFRRYGDGTPSASDVVAPSPWSAQEFVTALSDPRITTALTTDGVLGPPAGFLHPADLGAGFSFDAAASHGTVNELQLDNGCDDKSVFNLPDGRMAVFDGTAPGGQAVVVGEGEYKLPGGTGPATFTLARHQGQGGCAPGGDDFSRDTVAPLPAGLGDGAFLENQVGNHTVRILIRFGDTVLDTQIHSPDYARAVDLSSPAGQAWLTGVARQIAARWTAKD